MTTPQLNEYVADYGCVSCRSSCSGPQPTPLVVGGGIGQGGHTGGRASIYDTYSNTWHACVYFCAAMFFPWQIVSKLFPRKKTFLFMRNTICKAIVSYKENLPLQEGRS